VSRILCRVMLCILFAFGSSGLAACAAGTNGLDVGVAAFPVVFSSPETGVGGGVGAVLTFRGEAVDSRPNSLALVGMVTEKSQSLLILSPEAYVCDDYWKLKTSVIRRDWPDEFYGIGNDTEEEDEEAFEVQSLEVRPSAMLKVWRELRAGLVLDWKDVEVSELVEDGLLATGGFLGTEGTESWGLGPALEWDTRDSLFFPMHGSWLQLNVNFYRDSLGSDYDYDSVVFDWRRFLSVGSDEVLAFQVHGRSMSGDVPFDELSTLELMRGVPENRFRDMRAASMQVEYRVPVWSRVWGVAFASTGSVFERWSDWDAGDLKYAGGVGVRYALNKRERINLRVDIGFSEEGVFPYIQMREAF